ncbi:DNA polymerase III subunit gamma/tau [Vagococcus intermedius]|uniref:DNA-directed DNA polymerase n=1 Tax=Vagococcus intermedius TaxID=2991418 RepID=A0AAF0CTT8_9ENTE|nr:DNA polymerase III subunit gamma/tau [Vagococcus intermedius]WEG72865.1 DNA polymerase III subunit gamma/tau [Vagococcus intermedius]WEG74952.1 DNA polymerase III subunit gamma/tau [Vagococcus intermedius]
MTYQALYRVWRSQRFDTIVGQQMVTQTLKNAIIQKKTSHAYLFTGPRGTGKTSAAKIFAKAINCPNNHGGEPCNECDICLGITEGRLNDVIEIDAASNNGVEEIRDIREKVKYAPTQAEFKVYIIDEVHMLSTGAFNALLKTLEEPPKNVIFILATTEPHKIPLTIISRTQRFDFKRIDTGDIVTHMGHILTEMGIDHDEQSLYVIARAAEGGMRDALSILDQALSFSEGALTVNDALQVTGSLTFERMDQLIEACQSNQTETGLTVLHDLLAEGKESSRILEDLLLYCRDLLMFQQAPNLLANQNGQLTAKFKELSTTFDPAQIYQFIKILSDTQKEIRFTNHPDIYLEVAIVKLANLRPVTVEQVGIGSSTSVSSVSKEQMSEAVNPDISELIARLDQLENKFKSMAQPKTAQKTATRAKTKPQATYRLPKEKVYQILDEATRSRLIQVQDAWEELLQLLTVTQRAMLKASQPVAASDKGLVLTFDYEIVCQRASEDTELQARVVAGLERLLQYSPTVICIPSDGWKVIRREFIQQHQASEPEKKETRSKNDLKMADTSLEEPPETVAFLTGQEEPDEEEQAAKILNQAVDFFGETMIEVIDD